jgi:hypothetical protein
MRAALALGTPALIALAVGGAATPAGAQTYYGVIAGFRNGQGYLPATAVAGWERDRSFTVIAIAPDGDRVAGADVASDWKATIVTGPREAPKAGDDDEEDDRYLDPKAPAPEQSAPAGPPVPRTIRAYASLTCPAILQQLKALKPMTGFEFAPPNLKGNEDGPRGDSREGLDLWIRIGDGEINKSAGTPNSMLGRWFEETTRALSTCPETPKPKP